jgi:hypothetical protein
MAETATPAVASSGVTQDQLKTKLTEKLEATHVEILDQSGMLCVNGIGLGTFQ